MKAGEYMFLRYLKRFMEYRLKAIHYRLEFRHAFHIAHGSRTGTDTVYAEIKSGSHTGYGEAALPPYLGYDAAAVVKEINTYWLSHDSPEVALNHLHKSPLSRPAKTAIDIALHDLWGKLEHKPVYDLRGISLPEKVICFYTLGISSIKELEEKLEQSSGTQVYKIKLGGENDHAFLNEFRARSKVQFCADANQAWKDKNAAINEIEKLHDLGCIFIEQPLPVDHPDQQEVFNKSKLPIYLDESIQSIADIHKNAAVCHGINIKLVKTGGIQPALQWIDTAKKQSLEILIGCMSESSCGAAAALQLSSFSKYVDVDGPLLIRNDPFKGLEYEGGMIRRSNQSGLGIILQDGIF
jgi:L-alanine-DL-glutamate epimerase-like enolase superfamily enzyme